MRKCNCIASEGKHKRKCLLLTGKRPGNIFSLCRVSFSFCKVCQIVIFWHASRHQQQQRGIILLGQQCTVLGSFHTSWVSPEGSLPVSKHDAESLRSGKLGTVTQFPIAARVFPEEGLWLSRSELFLQPLSHHWYSLAAVQESAPSWCFFSYFFSSFLASF